MNIPYVMKKCNECGRWLVANIINFNKRKDGKYKLHYKCKECQRRYGKKYYDNNFKKEKQTRNEYKKCSKCGKLLPNTNDFFAKSYKRKDGTYSLKAKCKECVKLENKEYHKNNFEKEKAYREANKDRIEAYRNSRKDKTREYDKKRYEENKEKIVAQHKAWREANKEKIAQHAKEYNATEHARALRFNRECKRRHREKQLGDGLTTEQWLEMMNYFDWKCAYSGEYIGGKKITIRTVDHIVPLNKNGVNEIWNCVPMTKSLNSSKQDKDMLEWYEKQDCYSEERLAKIREWQEYAYKKYSEK